MGLLKTIGSRAELMAAPGPHTFIFFWGHTPKEAGVIDKSCMSQWFPARFSMNGPEYKNAEQFMMASKARLFGDDETLAKILAADDPATVKKLGREVRGFDSALWDKVRFELVVTGSTAKFAQNAELLAYLLGTGDAILVEASPHDTVWGIGLEANDAKVQDPRTWRGENLLGFALMKARDEISAARASVSR